MQTQERPAGKRIHTMPSKLQANAAKTAKAEAEAREANEAKLAKLVRKQAPAPVLAKGSGALIGVAAGATERQPHTKRAVAEARKAALMEEARSTLAAIQQKPGKGLIKVLTNASGKTPEYGYVPADHPMAFEGKLFLTQRGLNNAKQAAIAKAPAADKKSAPPKAAKAPADQVYTKGPNAFTGREGTWTHYMVNHVLKHKSTAQATAAQTEYKDKKLDFKWMNQKGFITLK